MRWLIGGLCLGAAMPTAAQAQTAPPAQTVPPQGFAISGTTRLRFEAIDGQARAGFNTADDLVSVRTTLLAQYTDGPIRVAVELWDSRAYGANAGTPLTTGEVNAVELVQAFVEARTPGLFGAGSTASIQAGRFVLNLGSRRLIAADDYRNTTNGYTGVRADVGLRSGWKGTAIYVLPQQRRPDDVDSLRHNAVAVDREGFDLVLWGGVVSRSKAIGAAMLETSFFHLGERDLPGRPTRDRSLNTASVRVIRDPAPARADVEVEGIAQRGHASTGLAAGAPQQAVRAWFVHVEAGYTFAARWQPRLSLEYDHASGDAPGGANGRFDTLFGMRRADLAPAGLYNAYGRANSFSPGARIEVVPGRRTDAFAIVRPIWLASRTDSFSTSGVRDSTGRSGNFAGTQLDARVRRQVSKAIRVEVDGVVLDKGRFLRDAPNAPPGKWTRYLSLNALASF
jgi:hypothetical protein